ncbi:MAG: hypothetical protein V3V33_04520 [Candidatus Lokiarchaeia archaeon]
MYGITYLRFYKALKKLRIEFLVEHIEEFYYLSKYREYGIKYLKFLGDAINLELDEIVNMKGLRKPTNSCILKWAFMSLNDKGRSENN